MLQPGAVALGRLDVVDGLDGVEDGLWALGSLAARGVVVLNRAGALLAAHDKLLTAKVLQRAGLPHPRTRILHPGGHVPDWEGPVVVKPRFGSWGRDVELCERRDLVPPPPPRARAQALVPAARRGAAGARTARRLRPPDRRRRRVRPSERSRASRRRASGARTSPSAASASRRAAGGGARAGRPRRERGRRRPARRRPATRRRRRSHGARAERRRRLHAASTGSTATRSSPRLPSSRARLARRSRQWLAEPTASPQQAPRARSSRLHHSATTPSPSFSPLRARLLRHSSRRCKQLRGDT